MIRRILETRGFHDEITKIALFPRPRTRQALKKIQAELRKRKSGLAGAAASYGATMGAAPLLGYGAGRLLAPGSLQKSREELKKPESVILHSIMPGYSEYLYGRKSRAREKVKGSDRKRKSRRDKS